MIQNYFKTAWRNLVRHKGNTTINILGLTLGITVCLIIFLLVRFELSYDNFHPDKDRIYRVVYHSQSPIGTKRDGGGTTSPLPDAARTELTGLETVAGFDVLYENVIVPREGKVNLVFDAVKYGEGAPKIVIAQPQYFDIFHYRWLAGNAATALNEPYKVVLSAKEATRYFGPEGDPDGWLGRSLIYMDSLPVTVSGIVADWDRNSDFGFCDFISYSSIAHSFLKDYFRGTDWGSWDGAVQAFVKLTPGVTRARMGRQLQDFTRRHIKDQPGGSTVLSRQPLSDIHFNEKYKDSYTRVVNLPTLYGLMAIAVFILLIAAINFINLSTAQSVERAREIGVRKVLGGRRPAIILQFLSETLLIVLVATSLALAATGPLLSAFHSMLPAGIKLDLFNGPTILFIGGTALVTCLLAGFYPARVLSSYQPALSLKGRGAQQAGAGGGRLRKSLIVFQFTVSLVFIIGTLIIGRQIHFVLNTDLGFDRDAIVILRTGNDKPFNRRAVLAQKIRAIPGVQMVSRHMETPTAQGYHGTSVMYKGATDVTLDAAVEMSDTNYLPLYGLHLVAGRNLLPSDTIREFLDQRDLCAGTWISPAGGCAWSPGNRGHQQRQRARGGDSKRFSFQVAA